MSVADLVMKITDDGRLNKFNVSFLLVPNLFLISNQLRKDEWAAAVRIFGT